METFSAADLTSVDVSGCTLVINEFLADPAPGADANCDGDANVSADELVELLNVTDATIDLSNATISDGSGTPIRHTFAADTFLAPGEAIVVFGGGTPNALGCWDAGLQVVVASPGPLNLNNEGDLILVHDSLGAILAGYGYTVEEGEADQSITLAVDGDVTAGYALHSEADSADGSPYSPATRLDGAAF